MRHEQFEECPGAGGGLFVSVCLFEFGEKVKGVERGRSSR
jgi:hypothetical protein